MYSAGQGLNNIERDVEHQTIINRKTVIKNVIKYVENNNFCT